MSDFEYGSPFLPEMHRQRSVVDLLVGERAYLEESSLWFDPEWRAYIDGFARLAPLYSQDDSQRTLPIYRLEKGFVVDLVTHCDLIGIAVEDYKTFHGVPVNDERPTVEEVLETALPVFGLITTEEDRAGFLHEYEGMMLPDIDFSAVARQVRKSKSRQTVRKPVQKRQDQNPQE